MYKRISIDPNICHGQACIKNTRVPVHQIIRMLANGDKIEELLEDYPPQTAYPVKNSSTRYAVNKKIFRKRMVWTHGCYA